MVVLLFSFPLMVLLGGVFLAIFIWAVRHDQFEDLEEQKYRIFR
jgi:cbb3-type cytochrome oxidase maturation protein